MPVTGVGKIYKPALRLQAAQLAFEAALAPLRGEGVTAGVTVRSDPTHGMLAAVSVTELGGASREAIVKRYSELLGGFQLRHVIKLRSRREGSRLTRRIASFFRRRKGQRRPTPRIDRCRRRERKV